MRKTALFVSLVCCIFYLGCSGRTPNPVLSYMPGDNALSCEELKIEMAVAMREIALKPAKIKEREARNQGLNVFGALLIYPWFEKDILEAEETEIRALHTRYNHLFMIAAGKHCALGNQTMTLKTTKGREPTVDEILDNAKLSETARFLEQLPNQK